MAKFRVQVGRDARVYYSAIVEAEDLDDAMSKLSRHGYDCPDETEWNLDGVDDFDNVETCAVCEPEHPNKVLVSYTDREGWTDG